MCPSCQMMMEGSSSSSSTPPTSLIVETALDLGWWAGLPPYFLFRIVQAYVKNGTCSFEADCSIILGSWPGNTVQGESRSGGGLLETFQMEWQLAKLFANPTNVLRQLQSASSPLLSCSPELLVSDLCIETALLQRAVDSGSPTVGPVRRRKQHIAMTAL
jgi:hypothetical protein